MTPTPDDMPLTGCFLPSFLSVIVNGLSLYNCFCLCRFTEMTFPSRFHE